MSKEFHIAGFVTNFVSHVSFVSMHVAHRKFHCARDILLQEMPYFQKYLNEKLSDAEISVHCDINIFEWLISYVKKRTSIGLGQKDCDLRSLKLVPSQSISILISSYFLQMDKLVEESLNYCHKNMTEVLETNSNLNCISRPLMTRYCSTNLYLGVIVHILHTV